MVIFLSGTDTYTPRARITAITESFLAKNPSGAGLTRLDCGDGATVATVRDALSAVSLFASRNCVIVTDPWTLTAADQRALAEIITTRPITDDVLIVWQRGTPRAGSILLKALTTVADINEVFIVPPGGALATWIARRAAALVATTRVAADAAALLAARIPDDMDRLNMTLKTLVAVADGGVITRGMVETYVLDVPATDAFATVAALGADDRTRAMALLSQQMTASADHFRLWGLYAYQIRTLLAVADCVARHVTDVAAIVHETGLKPFAVTQARRAHLSRDRLMTAHTLLTRLDRAVKTGACTIEDALTLLVAKV